MKLKKIKRYIRVCKYIGHLRIMLNYIELISWDEVIFKGFR